MILFYLPHQDESSHSGLPSLLHLDPDRDWTAFRRGEHAWILQTCLRLRRAGQSPPVDAELVDALPAVSPESKVVVFHSKHRHTLRKELQRRGTDADLVLVGVRGDLKPARLADLEILQNGVYADDSLHAGQRRVHVPHWPQAGLQARDPQRGTRVEHLAYKGFHGNLHPAFHDPSWPTFLHDQDMTWDLDSVAFQKEEMPETHWPDYRDVDLVLAVRPPDRRLHSKKPATKLVNAWHAGVPALLGPEAAYRELRRSELDYIEVEGLDDAKAAIRRLRTEPGLYRAMVENGRERAKDYTFDAVREHWRRRLCVEAAELAVEAGRWKRWPLWLRAWLRGML